MNKKLLSQSRQANPKSVSAKRGVNGSLSLETSQRGVKKKRGKSEKSKAMKTADDWFSRWVRLVHSFDAGGVRVCKCYTCGKFQMPKEIQNGHWQRRGYKQTRYHENDARPQCVRCNKYLSGMPEVFELNLRRDIGDEQVDALKELAQADFRDSTEFYREQSEKYRKLVNELVEEYQINKWW